MTEGNLKSRLKVGMLRTQILLSWSLDEAIQTADSMKARGYGIGKKSSYIPYQMEKRDWGWFIFLFSVLLFCILGGLYGYGKIVIYPELGTLHLYMFDWILYVCMIILYSFPLIVEGREQLKWICSK